MTTLVTGGTGGLGRPTVAGLRDSGREVRVLSRHAGEGHVVADLSSGVGLANALAGVDTVVHCATNRRKDAPGTRRLLAAAKTAGVGHVVFISIVGVDHIPYFYYRDKVEVEGMVERSGIPYTIQRATQFHDFVATFFTIQARLPFTAVLDVEAQPIAVEEVAARLGELAVGPPAGRVPDIGGPERLHLREFARQWHDAQGHKERIRTLPLGGRVIRAFQAGHHMTPLPGFGSMTFRAYADAAAGA